MRKKPRANSSPADERYMTFKEIAELLGVHERTLHTMKHAGQLPPHYVFGYRTHRWKRAEVMAWMRNFPQSK